MACLPFKEGHKSIPNPSFINEDIIEEGINLFRTNCFIKDFEIKGPSDRTLIYVMLWVGDSLSKINITMEKDIALKALNLNISSFPLPTNSAFPLSSMFTSSTSSEDEELRSYLLKLRSETINRLIERIYPEADGGKASPWWLAFQKRKFMNKSCA